MTLEEIAERLNARFAEVVQGIENAAVGDSWIVLDRPRIASALRFLRDDPELSYEWMMCLSGVDYPPDRIAIVYHLYSQTHDRKLVVKIMADRNDPRVPSVESVWRMADWYERECYDMFGVIFEGHPDLRRILLPFDWEGHPLRRDYVFPETYRGVTNKP